MKGRKCCHFISFLVECLYKGPIPLTCIITIDPSGPNTISISSLVWLPQGTLTFSEFPLCLFAGLTLSVIVSDVYFSLSTTLEGIDTETGNSPCRGQDEKERLCKSRLESHLLNLANNEKLSQDLDQEEGKPYLTKLLLELK